MSAKKEADFLEIKKNLVSKYERLARLTSSDAKRKALSQKAEKYRRQVKELSRAE